MILMNLKVNINIFSQSHQFEVVVFFQTKVV